jgi:hypothetical protein
MPEPHSWLEKSQEQRDAHWLISCPERKLSMQFTVSRHSRNCNMHYMTSTESKYTTFFDTAQSKDTAFLNMIMHAFMPHA